MKQTLGRISVAAVALLLVGLGGATIAWACFPAGYLQKPTPEAVAPGEAVTVRGHDFRATDGPPGPQPVELRLDSPEGQILETTEGPNFTKAVEIPAGTSAGYHYIVAVLRCECGGVPEDGKEVIEVTAAQEPSGGGSPATGGGNAGSGPGEGSGTGSPQPDGGNAGSGAGEGSGTGSPQPGGGNPGSGAGGGGSGDGGDDRALREGRAARARARTRSARPVRRDSASGTDAARRNGQGERSRGGRVNGRRAPLVLPGGTGDSRVTTPSGRRVFAGSLPPDSEGAQRRGGSGRESGPSPWAGPRRPNAAGSEKLPSLTSPSGSVDEGLDPRLGIGLALLGLGIVLPLGGFLVAEMRRRRAQPRRALRR